MKKLELKTLADFFGAKLPAGKIKDRETRLAIVGLYSSLALPMKKIDEEIESVRKSLVGDKQDEIEKYAALIEKGDDDSAKEAASMKDCVKIESDFSEAVRRIYEEDIEIPLRKVSLALLYDALCDCGFDSMPIAVVENTFYQVIE